MEDEIYIYKGEEFTRKELEGQYGDRLDEAIDTFGIKKKDLTQSPASLAMQEGFPQAVGTDSEDIDDEEFTRNRAATEVISEIENVYKLGEQYSEFVKKHGVQTEESAKSFPTLQERLFALETIQYGDDKKLYTNSQLRANADKINKLYKTVSDSEEELVNINQQDKTISFDAERYRNALTRTQAFSNQIKKIEREEQEFIEGLPDFVVDDLVAASTSAGRAVVNLFDFASILYDAENVSDRQIKNQFKTIGAKKGLGLSQEQIDKGIAGSIEDGDISAAFTNLVVDGAAQVPQLGAALAVGLATRNPELGMNVYAGIAGANAGAAKYAELISDPTMSETGKVLSSVAVGLTEALASRVFTGGTQSLIRRLGAEGVKRNMPKGILSQARAYGLPLTKGIADEALEEGFAQGFESFIVDHVIRGEEFNPYAVADAMIIGATMGGSVTSATLLPSYRGSYKTAKRRAEIGREIKRINNTIRSGNLSDAEQEAANNKIFSLKKEANNLRKEDAILYKDMSREDTEEVIRLNRRISLNRDRAIDSRTEEGKNLIKGEIALDIKQKEAIEKKYDSKTEEQVPSTEQAGEAAVEAQPDTEAGEAAVETGRVVQLDEETQGELDDVMRDADFTVSEQEAPTRTSKTEAYADEGVQGGIINLIKTKGGELGREFVGAIERIKSTLGEGYKVVVLDDARYRDVTNTKGRGAYDTKNKVLYLNAQQVRNLDKDNVRAVYHEAIHPILTKRFGEASADFVRFKQDLVNAINRSLSGQDAATLIARLEAFEKQYKKDKTTEQQAEEFMTELGAIMTSEDVELLKKSGLLNRVKELINNLLRKLGVDISLDTENDVVEFMNSLAQGVRGGVAVEQIVPESKKSRAGGFKESRAFKSWKGDNKLVSRSEVQDVKTSQPIVAEVYHGTTNEFYEFDSSVKGNIEGHLGRVNYFTTDYQDAANNYQEDGADLTSRIDRRSEELESTLQYEYSDDFGVNLDLIKRDFGLTDEEIDSLYPDGVPKTIEPNELSYFIAEKELKGGDSKVLEVFVKLNNPVVLGGGATWFETLEISEEDFNDAAKEIAEENDISLEEAKEDYDYEVRYRAIENSGDGNAVVRALESALSNNGYESSQAVDILGDNYYETEIDLNQLEDSIRRGELYENLDGEFASSQVISDFFKNLGFDGIIITNVSERFRNMGLSESTSHVHVFDEYNNQIKLSDGTNTTFDSGSSDIRESRREEGVLAEGVDVSDSSNRKGLVPTEQLKEFIGEDRVGDAELPTSRRTIDNLKEDIKRNGFKEPIVVVYDKSSGDGEASILEGNHRMQAAIELGLKEVPVAFEKGTLRTDEQRVAEGMFPLNRKTVGQIDTRLGVDGTELGLDVRQPNEGDFKKPRVDEDTFLQESRAIINEQFLSEEKQVIKFRKAGVDNKQTQQAINDIGLKGVKFTKEGIEEAIQKAFDDLSARAESFVMTEDSKAITGAIMADIEAMRADGASESEVAYAKRGLEEGSPVRGEYIRKFQDAQRNEIRNWVSYLNQSDYNTSFKYLILDGVLTNNYDKKRNKYVKRDRKTLRSVTPFNAASLAELYQSDSKEMLKDYTDIQEKNAIALAKSRQVATTTEGEWIKYDGGDGVSNEDIANNASELAGLVSDTPWCTKTNAASQLRAGDFYVYATKGEDGSMIPRIAIRMEGDQVGEVRGVASEKQDLEPSMNPVAEKFLKENIPNDSGQGWLDSIEYNEKAEQLLQDINEKGLNRERMVSYFELLTDENKYTQDYGRNGHIERLEAKVEELVENNELSSDLKGKVIIPNNASRKANRENLGNAEFVIGNLELKPSDEDVRLRRATGDSEFNVQYVSGNATVIGDVTNIKFVGGDLRFLSVGSPISVEVVGGNVGAKLATNLGKLRKVGGDLDVNYVKDLGNLEEVGGTLDISDSDIKSLGNKIKSVHGLVVGQIGGLYYELESETYGAPLEYFGSLEKVEDYIYLTYDNLLTILPTENNIRFVENNIGVFDMAIDNISDNRQRIRDKYLQEFLSKKITKEELERKSKETLLGIKDAKDYIQYLKDKAGEAPLQESRNFDRKTEKAMEGKFYQPKIDERFNKASKRQMANKKLFDRQGIIRRALQDANDLITQAALSVRNGSSAAAKKMYERFNKNIFLNVAGAKLAGVNEIIMLRRIISIYDGFDRGIDTFQQEIKDLEAKKKRTKKETARLNAVKKQLADLEAKKANFKNPQKLNRESALARLDEIKQELRDETGNDQQFFDMDNRASRFFAAMREILKRKLDEGLITQDEYFRLSKYEYSPRMFVDKVFDLQNGDFAKHEKRFMGYGLSEKEFKKLKEGSEEDLFTEGDFLLRMVVAASERRVFANRLFKQLGKKVGSYEWLSDTKKNGFSELTYKEDGESRSIYVRNDIAEEIENADSAIEAGLGKVGKYFGTNILRAMATGYNPLFPLSNIPMDFANVVMFTDTYDDKSLVRAMIELSNDFRKNLAGIGTITAAFRGTTKADPKVLKNLEEAFEAGIGMDFLTNQGRVKFKSVDGSKLQRAGQTFGDFMSSFGENSELAMRLSVYNKVKADSLKKRKDGDAQFKDMNDAEIRAYAAFKARATIDFSQGGSLAKSLDKMSPYFNASLQGLRVAGNYIRTNPAKAAKKFGEAGLYAITMSVVMQQLFEMFGWDDDDKEAIPEYHRRNYFIIPTSDTDEDGNKKYIKIRKLPQLAPFLRLFELVGETTYRSMSGENEESNKAFYTKGLVDLENTLKDATVFGDMIITFDKEGKPSLDVGVAQYLPPFMKGYIQYITNYDFFRERKISYEKLYNQASPEFEGKFDDNVEEFYKEFGELTGMSPKRTKNAVEVVTTSPSTNLMVGVGYGIANAIMTGDKSFKDVTRGMEKRAVGTANKKYIPKKPSAELNKLLQEYKDNQFVVRKELTKMVVEDNAPKKDVIQYVNGIEDRKLREYAIKKYKKLQRKNKFDDLVLDRKSVYYNLDDYMSEKPELAAEYLFNEFGSLTNPELREVASYISMIRGTRSFSYPPAFMRKYRELQK